MGLAAEYLRPGGSGDVTLIVDAGGESQVLKLEMLGYQTPACPLAEPNDVEEPDARGTDPGFESLCDHLYRRLRGQDNLVFANSRQAVELISDRLRQLSEQQLVPNEFLPHHGSLSKALREEVEARLKESTLPLTAVCTSTLEMGIDIGSVESIAQIGSPPSVASLRQRLGRSGRRPGQPAVLRAYVLEDELTPRSSLSDMLRVETVQMIAMLGLLLERWCEPPESGAFHYSTLIQQVLSLVAQFGGIRALPACRMLCESGPFATVDGARFAALLRGLGQHEMLAQMGDGTLILGAKGETVVNHYQFYSAFIASEEYRIVHRSRTLGQIPMTHPLQADMHIIFAGRRWKVVAIDSDARLIEVEPSAGGSVPRFNGSGAAVHDRVRQRMLEVYQSTDIPIYLSGGARELLQQGRGAFSRLGLAAQRLVADGHTVLVFPWAGDRVIDTLVLALLGRKLQVGRDGIAIQVGNSTIEEVRDHLRGMIGARTLDTVALARAAKDAVREKYDHLVPSDLAAEDFAARRLDGPGTIEAVRSIV